MITITRLERKVTFKVDGLPKVKSSNIYRLLLEKNLIAKKVHNDTKNSVFFSLEIMLNPGEMDQIKKDLENICNPN